MEISPNFTKKKSITSSTVKRLGNLFQTKDLELGGVGSNARLLFNNKLWTVF